MFTGLVEEIGKVKSITNLGGGRVISVKADLIMSDLKIDDSVALNGACQTVVKLGKDFFDVVAVEETLAKTTLGDFKNGDSINLERALSVGDRLGGHIVQGHVDCVGKVTSITKLQTAVLIKIEFPVKYRKYLVQVGSVCVNGVSLTAAKVEETNFTLSIIPHTLSKTTLALLKSGDKVNLEFDVMAKYVENMLKYNDKPDSPKTDLSMYIDQPEW